MTIVREPRWDDAPRTKVQGVVRHFTAIAASVGWATRILVSSVVSFPAVFCRRSGRSELSAQLYMTGIRTLPVVSVVSLFTGFLAAPRVLALTVMAPILAFYCCVAGTVGGGIVGVTQLGVDFGQYMASAVGIAETKDLFVGLLKSTVFGLVIGAVSVSEGFATVLGATGVGKATQRSVIICFLLILMLGYMITRVCYR